MSVEVEASIQMTLPPPYQIQKDQTRPVASKKRTRSSAATEAKSIVVPEPKKEEEEID
ncbi:hypothetical protein ACE6H2_020356 [Prunus campanulata]